MIEFGHAADGESYEKFHADFVLLRRWASRIVHPNRDWWSVLEWYGPRCKQLNVRLPEPKVFIPPLHHEHMHHLPTLGENLHADQDGKTIMGDTVIMQEYIVVKTARAQPGFDNYAPNNGHPLLEENKFSEVDATTNISAKSDVAGKLKLCSDQGFNRKETIWALVGPRHVGLKFDETVKNHDAFKEFKGTVIALVGDDSRDWYGPTFSCCAAFHVKSAEARD